MWLRCVCTCANVLINADVSANQFILPTINLKTWFLAGLEIVSPFFFFSTWLLPKNIKLRLELEKISCYYIFLVKFKFYTQVL